MDSDPVPKNDINFKLSFEAKQEGGHYFKVKFQWFEANSGPAEGESALKMD
jgi:hypothetical protein